MRRKVIYLGHAIAGDRAANLADARLWYMALVEAGYAPVAPYLETVGIIHVPDYEPGTAERELCMELDLAILERCEALALCGRVISHGMGRERDRAEERSMLIIRWWSRSDIQPAGRS